MRLKIQSIQWILLIVLVQLFQLLFSLSSYDEISDGDCVRETVKFNTTRAQFIKALFGFGQCPCNSSCPNLVECIEFYIYNPNTDNFQMLFLNGSNADLIDPNKLTTVFVHGFTDSFQPEENYWMNILCRMESQIFNRNTIAVNYGNISKCPLIILSNFHAPKIGDILYRMLNDILAVDLGQINCVGHSLGAHICGWAGIISGGKFNQCFGLDPGTVKYGPDRGGLRAISCQYVQAIHTDPSCLGTPTERGDIDFFVNVTCEPKGCRHVAAVEYYKASLDPNNIFLGQSCEQSESESESESEFESESDLPDMNCRFGPHNTDNCTGIACFDTTPCAPFVVSHL